MSTNAAIKSRFVHTFHNPKTAWIILCIGLILTGSAWYVSTKLVAEDIEKTFESRTKEISDSIYNRMIEYEQVLWGGVGFFNAIGHFDRVKWHDYVRGLKINEHWPGIQGIGLSIPIQPSEKSKHIESVRAEGFPEYTIRKEGDRDEYSAIILLEPFDWRNRRAFGYDMWSNDMRRAAMARARDTGGASTSGIITLVQETEQDVQRGFLTYLPLYKKNLPLETVEERRAAFLGWVYSPFRMGDLMQGILGSGQSDVEYEIFDGDVMTQETLLYDTNDQLFDAANYPQSVQSKISTLNLQGRAWTIQYTFDVDNVDDAKSKIPWAIGIGGLIVDILLFYVISSLAFLNQRAEAIAAEKTIILEEEKNRAESALAMAEVAQKKAEQANLAKSEFLSTMNHELRTPLTPILATIKMMKSGALDGSSEKTTQMLEMAESNCDRLSSLINDILDLSKIEAGHLEYRMESVSTDRLIADALIGNALIAKKYGVQLIPGTIEAANVNGDEGRLMQVLTNLISNAAKFSPKGETITVSATRIDGKIRFAVTDHGSGISDDFRTHIFDRFTQADSSDTRQAGGTGLGLSICKAIVEHHKGTIDFDSVVGEGSTFYFDLPELLI